MKNRAILLPATALCLAFAGVASAQNVVHITGSTAFRSAVYDALVGTAVFSSAPQKAVYGANAALDPHSGAFMEFKGDIGGATYIVKCDWSGSEAGIGDVVSTTQTRSFLADLGTGGVNDGDLTTATPSGAQAVTHTVDLAFADNSQAASKTKTPALTQGQIIGIIPFVWVKNAQGHPYVAGTDPKYDRFTNVTHSQIRVALTGGSKLALFTGNAGDTNYVYVSGRDNNSGTRVNTLADSGYGITKSVSQFNLAGTGGSPTITGVGNGGQSSGGTLSRTLGISGSNVAADPINPGNTGWYAIGYLGMPDYLETAVPTNAVALTYNGVAESTAAIREGQYSFWGHEWIYAKNAPNLTAAAQTVFNALSPATFSSAVVDNIKAIDFNSMHCDKTTDLSDPTHN